MVKCVNDSESSTCKSDEEIMKWLYPKQFEIYIRYEKVDFLQRDLKPTFKSDEMLTRFSPNDNKFEHIDIIFRQNLIQTYDSWINQFGNPTNFWQFFDVEKIQKQSFNRYGMNSDALLSLSFIPSNTYITYSR